MASIRTGVANTPTSTRTDDHERQQRRHRAGDAIGLLRSPRDDERGVDGNERRGQRAFAKQILEKVGMRKAAMNASASGPRPK